MTGRRSSSSAPAVSVVIPTQNGGSMLARSLESIDPRREGIELIIVDNDSRDGSVDKAVELFPDACVVRNDANHGFAHACNQGAAAARGEFILFLNNDAFLDPDNLDRLMTAARQDPGAAVWQPVNIDNDGDVEFSGDFFTSWGFLLHAQDHPQGPELRSVFSTKAACLLVRRAAFEALGGFIADYFAYFEESDLCWRARLAGWDVRVVPDTLVEHIGGVTTSRLLAPDEIRYLAFRNRLRTILANASVRSLARIVPLHVLGCLGFAVLFLLTGRARSTRAILSALAWPLRNPRVVLSQRRAAQALRSVPDNRVLRAELRAAVGPSIVLRHLRQQVYRWELTRQNGSERPPLDHSTDR